MAQTQAQRKIDQLTATATFAERLLALAKAADELVAFSADNGFDTGGASAIVQADIDSSSVQHFTPTIYTDVITIATNVSSALNNANRTKLRHAIRLPQV